MEGFGGFFNDPEMQRRLQEMAEQMQSAQTIELHRKIRRPPGRSSRAASGIQR